MVALQLNILDTARTAPRAAATMSGVGGAPLPSVASSPSSGPGEEGGAAAALLDSSLRDGRFLFHFEGTSQHVSLLIQDLRRRGYRRVAKAPLRIGQFSVELLSGPGRNYRLEWIEPRPARLPKGRRAKGVA